MTAFVAGQPVITTQPSVIVDPGLAVGDHVFTLVVIDDAGTQSGPARVVVNVVPVVPPPGPVVNPGPFVTPGPVVIPRPVGNPTPVVNPVRPVPGPVIRPIPPPGNP